MKNSAVVCRPFDFAGLVKPPMVPKFAEYLELRRRAIAGPPSELESAIAGLALKKIFELLPKVKFSHTACDLMALVQNRRDRLWHNEIIRRGAPGLVNAALAAVEPVGLSHLGDVLSTGGPILFVSLHQYLYSSILPAWIASMSVKHLNTPIAILLNSGSDPDEAIPRKRIHDLLANDVGTWMNHPLNDELSQYQAATVNIEDACRPSIAMRRLARWLGMGHVALILPDSLVTYSDDTRRRSISFDVGNETLYVPPGASWLAEKTDCALVPVFIEPWHDRHRIVFGRPVRRRVDMNSREIMRDLLEGLVSQTLLVHPAAYDGWEVWGHPGPDGEGDRVFLTFDASISQLIGNE